MERAQFKDFVFQIEPQYYPEPNDRPIRLDVTETETKYCGIIVKPIMPKHYDLVKKLTSVFQ